MDIMAFILILLSSVLAETQLKDGETVIHNITSFNGGEDLFSFKISKPTLNDLVISLTSFSDNSDPDMYVRKSLKPSFDNYDYSSISWGSGSIVINSKELEGDSDYKILVVCYTFCKFSLTVSYSQKIKLADGIPIFGELSTGKQGLYSFNAQSVVGNTVSITLTVSEGVGHMYVVKDKDKEPTSDNSEIVDLTWSGNYEYVSHEFTKETVFKIAVMAENDVKYTLLVKGSKSEATLIQASIPVSGEVATSAFNMYYISILSPAELLSISLTLLNGDGDLYVKADSAPSLTVFDFSSIHMGNENLIITPNDRQRINRPTGKYYIGIYGYTHATYTLTVSTTNSSFIQLQPGIPQSSSVNQSNFAYFFIESPAEQSEIEVILSVSAGNPDLYVKLCTKRLRGCTFTEEELKSLDGIYSSIHEQGSESLEIPHDPALCASKQHCAYIIGVYGRVAYSTYTLTVSTNSSSELILQDGKPISLTASESTERFFRYTVFNESVSEVTFMLTPIYGDPDLYGSFNDKVTEFNSQKVSNEFGVEVDQIKWIKGVDSDSLKGTYHLMVFSSDPCSYSIVATSTTPGKNTTIQIYPGHPQKDTVYNYTDMDYRIYSFPVHYTEETKQVIKISLTEITGKFNLYAANSERNLDWNKEIFYYNWKSSDLNHSDPSCSITIWPTDPFYNTDSTYLILVMAEKFLADKSATFVINYSIGDGSVILLEDVPYTGVVLENEYSYFLFPVHFSHEDIVISVIGLSGDPDLFISVDPSNPKPTLEKYDFRSTSFGDEKITIPWEEGLKKMCPQLPEDPKFGDKTECFLFISVFGFQITTFEVRVHPSKGTPIFLNLGNSWNAGMEKAEYGFFYTFADATVDFKIRVQPEAGDPDLFVNVFDKVTAGGEMNSWVRPTKDKSDYMSQSTIMSEEVVIKSKDLTKKCGSKTCLILAATYCFSSNCTYLITATQKSELQSLIENQPTYGNTDNAFVYYSYYLANDFEDFLVTVTSLNGGNPDLYIRKGRQNFPNETHFDWSSTNWAGDSILITKDDKVFQGRSMKGTYIIGVKDPFGACSFSIIVNNHPMPIQKLISGVPQSGSLAEKSISYYSFANYIKDDITIAITPLAGSGKIYVVSYYSWNGDQYSSLPGPNKFFWSSDTSKDRYKIVLDAKHKEFCIYCEMLIAVVTEDEPLTFSITAKNTLDFTILQEGIPVRLEAEENRWSTMKFELDKKTDLNIAVTAYNGHPNIYVSKSKDLQSENYIRQAFYTEGAYNIKINKNDEDFFIGTYYIIVESNEPSSFSIVANTADMPIRLIDGWPIFYSFDEDEKTQRAYFSFVQSAGKRTFCYLKTSFDSKPTVFTKFTTQGVYDKPSDTNNDRAFDAADYQEIFSEDSKRANHLSMNLIHLAEKSQLNLLVFGTQREVFQIYCSGSAKTTVLRLGTLQIEMVDKDTSTKRYEVNLPNKGTLDAYVVPCFGDFKMQISSNWTVISQDNPDVVTTRLTDGMLMGSINNAAGNYYISITALHPTNRIQVYQFFSAFYPAKAEIFKTFKPGNNGMITWENKKEKKILLSWKPVEDDSGKAVKEDIVYNVYFTKDKDVKLVTACGIHYYAARKTVVALGSTKENSLEVKMTGKKGFFNVIAQLPRDSKSPLKEVVYDPMEVVLNNVPDGKGLLVFWLLATLLFLAVVASIYLYQKKRRAESRLRYELSDIRSLATVTPSSELQEIRKRDPYERLSSTN